MKKNRCLTFVVLILFLLQTFVPAKSVKADAVDLTNTFNLINKIEITDINGNKLPDNDISKSAQIKANYTWSIPNNITVNSGDYYTMQLPKQIKITNPINHQPIINGSEDVAYIDVDTAGKVKITFTNYPGKYSNVNGGFSIQSNFNASEIGDTNPVTIQFDLMQPIEVGPFNFKQEVPSVEKTGQYDPATDQIQWTVTVNKDGKQVKSASVDDVIPSGQSFVDGSVEINGVKAVSGTGYTYDSASQKLSLKLGDISAQKTIIFKTSIHSDLSTKSAGTYNYDNTAVLNYDTNKSVKASANVSVPVDYITKQGSYSTVHKQIDWVITVNKSNRTINDAVVNDVIPDGLTFDPSTYKVNGSPSGNYTINGQSLTCNLGDINTSQKIEFSTNVPDDIYNTSSNSSSAANVKKYENKATLQGKDVPSNTSASETVGVNTNLITKACDGYNASTGILSWTITVNEAQVPIDAGTVITDNILTDQKYVAGSGKIVDDSGLNYSLQYNDADGDPEKSGSLVCTLNKAMSKTIKITLQTKLIDKYWKMNGQKFVRNDVNLTSGSINQDYEASTSVNNQIINKKALSYDYNTRETIWQVTVNPNKMPMDNAVFTDNIPAGQEYCSGTAAIDNSASNSAFTYNVVTGGLSYDFAKGVGTTIKDTYVIKFNTKLTDLTIFDTEGKKTINNSATIKADGMLKAVESKASQNIDNTIVSKTPEYTNSNRYIKWKVNVNPNRNASLSKAVLTDNLSEGLSLNTDTVALYKAIVNSDGSLSEGEAVNLTGENVKYNPKTREFDFVFSQDAGKDAYILEFITYVDTSGSTCTNSIKFDNGKISITKYSVPTKVQYEKNANWGVGETGSITVVKVDDNDNTKKLSGAVFQLIDRYGNVKETSAPTGSDGAATFNLLKYDVDYSIKEITPPSGYNLNSYIYKFKIDSSATQKNITYYYKDTKIKGTIEFLKVGDDGIGIQGAEFTLYDKDGNNAIMDAGGNPITAISDENGKVRFKDAEYGEYEIKETKAPIGYVISPSALKASVSGDYTNTVVNIEPNSISNTKITGGIKITKTDISTSVPVPGADITIYNNDGTVVYSGKETGADGSVEFDGLPYGEYYFKETSAPEGYIINSDKHPFSIKKNGVTVQDTFSDTKITGGIKITKTDASTSAPVPGAVITIYDNDGKVIYSGKETGTDGSVEFDGLPYGDYYFKETNAPKGYIINNDKHPFRIKKNGDIVKDTFSDEKDSSKPVEDTNNQQVSNKPAEGTNNQPISTNGKSIDPVDKSSNSISKNNNSVDKKNNSTSNLPQTGARIDSAVLIFVGLISIILGAILFLRNKNKKAK